MSGMCIICMSCTLTYIICIEHLYKEREGMIITLMRYIYFHTWELRWEGWLSCITGMSCTLIYIICIEHLYKEREGMEACKVGKSYNQSINTSKMICEESWLSSFKIEVKGSTSLNYSLSYPSHSRATWSRESKSNQRSTLITKKKVV